MRSHRLLLGLVLVAGVGLLVAALFLLQEDAEPFVEGTAKTPGSIAPAPVAGSGQDEGESSRILARGLGREAISTPHPLPFSAKENSFQGMITGRVETTLGDPLSGADLELTTLQGMRERRGAPSPLTTKTDREGRFGFEVPLNTFGVLTAKSKGYAPASVRGVAAGDDVICVLERGGNLAGVVLDAETLYPIGGAEVSVRGEVGGGRGGGWLGGAAIQATTGGDGRFMLEGVPQGTTTLAVVALGYESGEFPNVAVNGEASRSLELKLEPGFPLVGVVLDDRSGTGIAGAKVTYRIAAGGGFGGGRGPGGFMGGRGIGRAEARLEVTQTTDANGGFAFAQVGLAGASLGAEARGYVSQDLPGRSLQPRDSEETVRVELRLVPALRVRGVVLDPLKQPIAGAEVVGWGVRSETIESDTQGRFTLDDLDPADQLQLTAYHPRYAPGRSDTFRVSEAPETVQIVLEMPGSITGTVVGPANAPEAGVRVRLRPTFEWGGGGMRGGRGGGMRDLLWMSDPTPLQITGADGRFAFAGLAPGRYSVSARNDRLVGDPVEVEVSTGQSHEVTLSTLPALAIAGRVTDRLGGPVAGARVNAAEQRNESLDLRGAGLPSGEGAADAPPRGRGRFGEGGVRGADRGPPGGNAEESARARTGRDGRDGGGLGNRIEQLTGFDPREVMGMLRGFMDGYRTSSFSDANGDFVVSGFPAGANVSLTASRNGYSTAREEASSGSTAVLLVMDTLVTYEGRVIDARTRAPLPEFSIELTRDDGSTSASERPSGRVPGSGRSFEGALERLQSRRESRFADAEGLFVIDRLVSGPYLIRARASDYLESEPVRIEVPVVPIAGPQITLALIRGASVAGLVTDALGEPAAGIPVFLVRKFEESDSAAAAGQSNGPATRRARRAGFRFATTDDSGRYSFPRLDAGDYELGVGQIASPVVGPVEVEVEDGRETRENLRLPSLASLLVTVRDAEGKPAARAMIRGRLLQARDVSITASTDNEGRAQVDNLLPGTYAFSAFSRGGRSDEAEVVVTQAARLSLDLALTNRDRGNHGRPGAGTRGGRGG
ncbi:MAG: carboxypeptidase-like regulatory domain-containing protein [Planctomycetota bacterium]